MQTPVPVAPLASAEPPIVSSVADAAIASAPRVSARVKLSLVLVYAVWSSTYLALRIVVEELPAFLSGGVRYVAAGVILAAVLRARGAPLPTARQWLLALPVGSLMFVMGNGFVAVAERTVSSGIAAVACATMPLAAAGLSLFWGERPAAREWAGLGLGFVGVVLLCLGSDLRADPLAMGLLMMAPLGWALGSILARRLALPSGLMSAASQMVAGGLAMLVLSPLVGEPLPHAVSWRSGLALAYLVVFGSLVGFSAYSYLLRATRPAIAMSYAYVNPALAVVLGALVMSERLSASAIGATALIVSGVLVLVRARTT